MLDMAVRSRELAGVSTNLMNAKMKYPSITICDGDVARIFGRNRFFESSDIKHPETA